LLGTFALATNGTRYVGVAALIVAAVLAVLIWGRQSWIPILPKGIPLQPHASIKKNVWLPAAVAGAAIILLAADLYNAGNPNDQFGLAGWLWLLSSGVLVAGSLGWSALNLRTKKEAAPIPPVAERAAATLPVCRLGRANHEHQVPGTDYSLLANRYSESPWCPWEAAVFAGIVLLASVLRIWNLSAYPDNIYPDEIMTGTVALGAYGGSTAAPSLFSTLWGQIDLPSLWFRVVWAFLQMGGDNLIMLRMPAALFGAATTVPFYLLVRGVWGRAAAIASTAILAFSASNIHYSRLALNNIVTTFFWTLCFLFLLRGLRSGKPINWAVAGLAAGLSEHFYYGTRLLPFVLAVFFAYLVVIHWRRASRYLWRFALLALGYVVGFGPLLVHFIRNPNLYFGRGAEMSVWHSIPTSLDELGRMIGTLWPIMAENLLGFSTHGSQDIIFFAPLLFPAEAALLVLGVGLLVWNWKHPAAFLMLLSGAAVLFVGGTLVMSLNSAPPQINHWTPAFPVFYATLGIPIGAWSKSGVEAIPQRLRWAVPAIVATGLAVLAALNINFYFNSYHADPNSLMNDRYRIAQRSYDALTALSRYVASLGPGYKVAIMGRPSQPYDATTTYYLMGARADVVNVTNPDTDLSSLRPDSKGVAFVFFPGNEQYQPAVRDRWPHGMEGQVKSKSQQLLFYTYVSYAPPEK